MRDLSCTNAVPANPDNVIEAGPIRMDRNGQAVTLNGDTVHLSYKEYQMLELLLLHKDSGTVVSKQMFLAHLYKDREEPKLKIIEVFICKLRKKLGDKDPDAGINTVWGRGYYLGRPLEEIAQVATPKPANPQGLPRAIPDPWHGLPSADNTHWVARYKLMILRAVADTSRPKVTAQSVKTRYGLSTEEFNDWNDSFRHRGIEGLKVTKMQTDP